MACPNCGDPTGGHFCPPSLNEPGFYICNKPTGPGPDPSGPLGEKGDSPAIDPLSVNNKALAAVDSAVQSAGLDPSKQMGVLTMALVLAMRRFLSEHKIPERGRRLRLIKEAVRQYDSKLREFVKDKPE